MFACNSLHEQRERIVHRKTRRAARRDGLAARPAERLARPAVLDLLAEELRLPRGQAARAAPVSRRHRGGGQRQTYIPAACAARAEEGVAQGMRLRAIVREITALNLSLLREAPE